MGPSTASSESVRLQIERILASPEFVNAERLSRFLRFTVEKAAAGQGDQLKEYVIGVEVYDRGNSYDPRIDAIVRVEAGRLRAKLQRYYDHDGRQDPIIISLPKGGYAPTITKRLPVSVEESPAARRFRGLSALIFIVVLAVAGFAVYLSRRAPDELNRNPSIVVLPLENLSADPEQEYFSDGMTDALITDLARIRALRVISRTSALSYKRAKKPLPQIARELGVDYVVEGTVRAGARVRITAQLIAARAERHVWAESYERDLRDILALQREVASAIAREVRVQLTPLEHLHLASARQVNRAAYEAYLKGRYYQEKRTEEGLKKSLEYFQESVTKDPGYGHAYSGLADSYTYLINHGYVSPREVGPQAKVMAMKAIEIDGTLAETHTSLAYIRMVYEWDTTGANVEFRRSSNSIPTTRRRIPSTPAISPHNGGLTRLSARYGALWNWIRFRSTTTPISDGTSSWPAATTKHWIRCEKRLT